MKQSFLLLSAIVLCAVLQAQNVGIGITNPGYPLTVQGNATTGKSITSKNGAVEVGFYNDGSSAYLQTWTPHDLNFATNNGNPKIILANSNGFVGINIITSLPTAQMNINGTLRIRGNGAAAGKVLTSDVDGYATWQPAGLTLPYSGTTPVSSQAASFSISNAAQFAPAGIFANTNASNNTTALSGTTSGTGYGVEGKSSGSGSGGSFSIYNNANASSALNCFTTGTGPAFLASVLTAAPNIAVFQSGGGSSNVARIDKNGKGFFNGGTQTGGADVAETFAVEGNRQAYEPGDVLIISTRTDRTVAKSNAAYSSLVVGVYATKPGVLLTERLEGDSINDLVPMGVVGVIPTKVCLQGGAIHRGDLLVTSSMPGHAMKGNERRLKTGMVIGKALEEFTSGGSGLIKVMVNVR